MYSALKLVHVACAVLTIAGFALRGYWMMMSSTLLAHRITRIAPHIIDSVFLLSGVAMLVLLSLNPLSQSWLVAKFVGLIAYILLGMIALRRGRTQSIRFIAFIGALLAFTFVVGVAITRSPASWLA
ncbi:MAG: SirB2 family protein [Gammaproteobacteria bacterium]|nr:SirB2 family protein [Gammaproteobacteria bacterium]